MWNRRVFVERNRRTMIPFEPGSIKATPDVLGDIVLRECPANVLADEVERLLHDIVESVDSEEMRLQLVGCPAFCCILNHIAGRYDLYAERANQIDGPSIDSPHPRQFV